MNEKILIKSEKSNIVRRILLVSICMMLLAVLLRLVFPAWWGKYYSRPDGSLPFDSFLLTLFAPQDDLDFVISPLLYLSFIVLIYGIVVLIANRNVTLTVTDHRVFGTASWGKRIDLPLDKISAVATAKLGGIAVSTSSGAIRFIGIKNNSEIHTVISKLLMERQESAKQTSATTEKSQTKADELREIKKLLDDGIITQEEFDAKKKQLLGL